MSQENVDLHRGAIDAVNRRDLTSLLGLMGEDVEVESRIAAVEGGLRGHEGVRRWWENWFGAFPDYEIEIGEIRDMGDVTLAAVQAVGHGAGSNLPFEDTIWHVCRWQGGKCVWWRVCYTLDEALEAAGLRE